MADGKEAATGLRRQPEDACLPARVIDELMGHQLSRRGELESGSRIGALLPHYPEMAARVIEALQTRSILGLHVAEDVSRAEPTPRTRVLQRADAATDWTRRHSGLLGARAGASTACRLRAAGPWAKLRRTRPGRHRLLRWTFSRHSTGHK
jgi:hypothetical protein